MLEKKTSGPVTVTIAIKNGMVKCEPACAYVRPGESIIWECPAGFPYAIHLGYGSPFKKVHHQKPGRERIELPIPLGTHHARVKYTVAVFDGTNVWIEDPEVIIRPEY